MPIINFLSGGGVSIEIDNNYSPFLYSIENLDNSTRFVFSRSATAARQDIHNVGIDFFTNTTCTPIETFQGTIQKGKSSETNVTFKKGKKYTRGANGGIYEDGVLFFNWQTSGNQNITVNWD